MIFFMLILVCLNLIYFKLKLFMFFFFKIFELRVWWLLILLVLWKSFIFFFFLIFFKCFLIKFKVFCILVNFLEVLIFKVLVWVLIFFMIFVMVFFWKERNEILNFFVCFIVLGFFIKVIIRLGLSFFKSFIFKAVIWLLFMDLMCLGFLRVVLIILDLKV